MGVNPLTRARSVPSRFARFAIGTRRALSLQMRSWSPVVAVCVVACGGLTYADYSDPDADLTGAQNGGSGNAPSLGHAGSACAGFEASIFEEGPSCSQSTDCVSWHDAYPKGLDAAFIEDPECVENHCSAMLAYVGSLPSTVSCTTDAYCRAFAQQFVTHGEAMGKCVPRRTEEGDPLNAYFCSFNCAGNYGGGDSKHPFCIEVDGAFRYAAPCADESTDIQAP